MQLKGQKAEEEMYRRDMPQRPNRTTRGVKVESKGNRKTLPRVHSSPSQQTACNCMEN